MKRAKRILSKSKRSIIKALTFRFLVIITNGILVYLVTGKPDVTAGVVTVTAIANTTLYFFHERLWSHVNWGRPA
ncbi:hypothetical protein A2Z33_05385 [Candidatus Gottesmanbacteria bacterium RBG_16_52_11]|uniref:DUF2061 domain-containing protein n=1 Tax=Candidatus Gottesmanbacteria bacterium RBG_16_52_11 TaxID=1798374 RepID=A0A1F5YM89_9BACT|nr:MAG: hypothetical protein A2Z33_05385 [Candidatus Gottesmanbacteria bacterium RBG_16_52_11]